MCCTCGNPGHGGPVGAEGVPHAEDEAKLNVLSGLVRDDLNNMETDEEWLETLRKWPLNTLQFCAYSLGDWLNAASIANVPAVPAVLAAIVLTRDALRFDIDGPHQNALRATWEMLAATKQPNWMRRFDPCSGLDLKTKMANGETGWSEECNSLYIDDMRVFDILMEYPRPVLPIWERPWVKPIVVDSYPVEYRAFVLDGALAGISSYYPQRPLPRFQVHLDKVAEYVDKLVEVIKPPFLWPSEHMNKIGVAFTVDFMAMGDGSVVLLEGGPPVQYGAHPCCFTEKDQYGVALQDRNQA